MLSLLRTLARRLFTKRPPMLEIGSLAPDFVATDHRGQTVRSADLAGTRYVLWFYPMADTPG
jgi:peroxiredoxin